MKKLCKSLLILTLILLTGCSFKGSMAQPIDKETSQLQQDIENLIESDNNIQEEAENYEKAINEVINNINSEEFNDTNE